MTGKLFPANVACNSPETYISTHLHPCNFWLCNPDTEGNNKENGGQPANSG